MYKIYRVAADKSHGKVQRGTESKKGVLVAIAASQSMRRKYLFD